LQLRSILCLNTGLSAVHSYIRFVRIIHRSLFRRATHAQQTPPYGHSAALTRLRAFGQLQTKGDACHANQSPACLSVIQAAFVAGASFVVGFSMETFMVHTGFYKIVTKKVRLVFV
jgi:hypothetical protein